MMATELIMAQGQVFKVGEEEYVYDKPNVFEFLTKAPGHFLKFGEEAFTQKYTKANLAIVASSAFLIAYDQPIYDQCAEWGRKWGIGNGDETKAFLTIGDYPLFRGPTDWGSAMYFIGDGWTHLTFSLSFLTAGLINDDNRALQTASQIAQGMVVVGTATQFLKHITGRETPSRATKDGGKWRFFPDQKDYHKHVPKYDAFPSGHLATATMTLTVIAMNYEEYKWIRPVGYGLLTLLSFQMINNGVHWAGDYPLAIGMGYLFGKTIVDSGRRKVSNEYSDGNKRKTALNVMPIMTGDGTYGFSMSYSF